MVKPTATAPTVAIAFHGSRWWRSGASHAFAFAAGIALALALIPRATELNNPLRGPPVPGPASEFHRALQAVMAQMNTEMCITPTGDADRDFARAMIPHHQGAVEMAQLELLYGHDPRLRRLAQGIVVEQSQEIALLRSVLASPSARPGSAVNPQGEGHHGYR